MAILKPDSTYTLNGVKVNKYLLTDHNPNEIAMPSGSMKPAGITIHNTDRIVTASGTHPSEQYTRATVNGNMGDVRVHFYVDNVDAWQNLPEDKPGWHAADGNGPGNRTTIAIECIMNGSNDSIDKKSEDNAAKLAAGLLHKYGFGMDKLYTHNHWYSAKYCPAYILPHWSTFANKVKSYLDALNKDDKPTDTNASKDNNGSNTAVFAVGSNVYVKAGAVDINGRSASSIYAGAQNPLKVKSVTGDVHLLYKGPVPVYRMKGEYLIQAPEDEVWTPGVTKVKVKPGSKWWLGQHIPSWVYNEVYYLQQLNRENGRAVIGTTPGSTSTTTTGAIDVAYLEKV